MNMRYRLKFIGFSRMLLLAVAFNATHAAVFITAESGANTWIGAGATNLWSNGDNWSDGVPTAGQDVAIDVVATVQLDGPTPELGSFSLAAGSLVFLGWDCQLAATNVTISGGTVTTAGAFGDSGGSNRVWISAVSDFSLTAPGKIDVSGKGYLAGTGPGVGVSSAPDYGAGAGHGGRGGTSYRRGGGTYDSLTSPVMAGSGGCGGNNNADIGGAGGGVVKIEVGGAAAINGLIDANGVSSTSKYGGGGAGGSINITASFFTGSGTGKLQVNGGNQVISTLPGGGGGGRIALAGGVVDALMAVQFSASPGKSRNDSDAFDPSQAWIAHWGTLYIEDNNFLTALPADNQLIDVILHIGSITEWEIPALTLTQSRFRLAPEGFTLKVAGDLKVGGTAHLGIEGSVYVGGDLVLTNKARLSVYAGLTTGNGSAYGAVVAVTNDIVIAASSWLQPHTHPTNGAAVLLRMRNLNVTGTAAGINASGRGFAGYWGVGRGGNGARGAGGGYGGVGGDATGGSAKGGISYGNPYAPLLPGSGGGQGDDKTPIYPCGGYGGGLIYVEAAGDVNLNGSIVANGCGGVQHRIWTGSGSGGGILISCRRFSGTATARLLARGGNDGGGAGGGGRITVWHQRMPAPLQAKLIAEVSSRAIISATQPTDYLGTVNVSGGDATAEDGTVWFITPPPPGAVIIVH